MHRGICKHKDNKFLLVDIPGTYSLMSNSAEEEIARDYICFGKNDCTIVVVDSTCIERNLNLVYQVLEITDNVVVCVNLLDEAKKKKIKIDLEKLGEFLGVPVVGTTARKKKTFKRLMDVVLDVCNKKIVPKPNKVKYVPVVEEAIEIIKQDVDKVIPKKELKPTNKWICLKLLENNKKIISSIEKNLKINLKKGSLKNKIKKAKELLKENGIIDLEIKDKIVSSIVFKAEEVSKSVVTYENSKYNNRDRKIDKILTSKVFGIPIMVIFLGLIFWITIAGANYPSKILSNLFGFIEEKLLDLFNNVGMTKGLTNLLVLGMYRTVAWVVAVMLPPMAIFFPLFTLLEDLGYLPRVAFNLDNYFKRACTTGKQALTMCMRSHSAITAILKTKRAGTSIFRSIMCTRRSARGRSTSRETIIR